MGRWVFVDTSAIVGIFLRDDEWHQKAKNVLQELKIQKRKMLASSDIFDEVVTAIRKWAGHQQAVRAGEILRDSKLLRVVGVDDETREAAWKLFRQYDDHELSFTDCTSFATMKRYGIEEAFTFDDDFRKVGFLTLPR